MITFLLENRLRAFYSADHVVLARKYLETRDRERYHAEIEAIRRYPFINLDSSQHAFVQADLKNIDAFSVGVGASWRFVAIPGLHSNNLLFGPSYAQTRTFETIETMALPQYADFGPLKYFSTNVANFPKISRYSRIYLPPPIDDESFYCYKSHYGNGSSTLENAIDDVYMLMTDDARYRDKVKFARIFVDGRPLAEWLMSKSEGMAEAYNYPVHGNYESVIPGQLQYNFTLDIKPSLEIKDSAIGKSITPFVVDFNASYEHSSLFSIIFNTPYALAANSAKQGNTCVGTLTSGLCKLQKIKPAGLGSRLDALPDRYDLPPTPDGRR